MRGALVFELHPGHMPLACRDRPPGVSPTPLSLHDHAISTSHEWKSSGQFVPLSSGARPLPLLPSLPSYCNPALIRHGTLSSSPRPPFMLVI